MAERPSTFWERLAGVHHYPKSGGDYAETTQQANRHGGCEVEYGAWDGRPGWTDARAMGKVPVSHQVPHQGG
ncbi:MAG: hypothetical protein ABH807_01175 [Candidatus Shapirobacteria bacterium]